MDLDLRAQILGMLLVEKVCMHHISYNIYRRTSAFRVYEKIKATPLFKFAM